MKDYRVYLVHILECLKRIENYTTPGKEIFLNNEMAQDAVLRNLEIIGEAAKRIPDDFRGQYPRIPWRKMGGLRDVLIHEYERVDLLNVWNIIQENLPPLKLAIESMLPPLDQLEREIAGEDE